MRADSLDPHIRNDRRATFGMAILGIDKLGMMLYNEQAEEVTGVVELGGKE
jgi:hypothetical protein